VNAATRGGDSQNPQSGVRNPKWRGALLYGQVIPASPLALTKERRLDERRQRALVRYYAAAGAGGLAVGVHTTQFAIRDPAVGLLEPVLALAAEELDRADAGRRCPLVRIAGICGHTGQAVREAAAARRLGYHAGLLSLGALHVATEPELLAHCRAVAEIVPLVGFYLQPAVGGRRLPFGFWRRFAEIENVVAVKIAPFNRYQTLDVVRAVAESGRDDVALYTGNDDNIVADLLTPFPFRVNGEPRIRRIVGGLLGQWSVWTRAAVGIHGACRSAALRSGAPEPEGRAERSAGKQSAVAAQDNPGTGRSAAAPGETRPAAGFDPADGSPSLAALLRLGVELTDANAAIFDAANGFAGCIAGIHAVLRRQRLLAGTWCLDPAESLSPGQSAEIDRVVAAYPHLTDDPFIAANRDSWLAA